jgi:hypothetical protein
VGTGSSAVTSAAREEAKEEGGRERRETRERVRLIASDCDGLRLSASDRQ